MIIEFTEHINELDAMKQYPNTLFAEGNTALLNCDKIAMVGSRKPSQYTKEMTFKLSQKLANCGYCIVSGAAMGVDAVAHRAAGKNTIAVMANGLDIYYPKVNYALIESIKKEGLVLSTYALGVKATRYSFVHRNELVVALGQCLIVTEADLSSGSMHSVKFAQKMGKKIYVLSQRIGESEGTNALVSNGEAEVITDVDAFVSMLIPSTSTASSINDELLTFCKTTNSYDKVVARFGAKVFEYELEGKIAVENSKVIVLDN